ncbi:hypothetical protein ILUMI_07123 [Ignelater luminosus]|uniref:Tetraspanin n=1 Tax=Ignelater luminosus TaxID=2038154 RepID=A0A8K0GBX0_IGNLU|nr:hypothetical protein ILUMI_07123 [Ignelater luminosus]
MKDPLCYMLIAESTFYILNLLNGILGFVIFLVGVRLVAIQASFELFLETDHFKPAFILFGTGVSVSLISVVGCLGINKRGVAVANVLGVFLLSLFFLENFFVLYTLKEHGVILADIQSRMTEVLGNYNNLGSAQSAWTYLQREFQCCGVTRPSDWAPMNVDGCFKQERGFNFTVPYSCTNSTMFCDNTYKAGCLDILENYFSDSYSLITCGLLAAFLVQLMGIFVAFVYARKAYLIRKQTRRHIQDERQRLLAPTPIERL